MPKLGSGKGRRTSSSNFRCSFLQFACHAWAANRVTVVDHHHSDSHCLPLPLVRALLVVRTRFCRNSPNPVLRSASLRLVFGLPVQEGRSSQRIVCPVWFGALTFQTKYSCLHTAPVYEIVFFWVEKEDVFWKGFFFKKVHTKESLEIQEILESPQSVETKEILETLEILEICPAKRPLS